MKTDVNRITPSPVSQTFPTAYGAGVTPVTIRGGTPQTHSGVPPVQLHKTRAALLFGVIGTVVILAVGAFFVLRDSKEGQAAAGGTKRVAPISTSANATKDFPFTNTLGMKFVPVPIIGGPTNDQRVLFSVFETRVRDYALVAKEAKLQWHDDPGFVQGPSYPAVMVSWEDAMTFCEWLTKNEHERNVLQADEVYRLPTDHEWSCAVGIGDREEAMQMPGEKHQKLMGVFPWGPEWPPPVGAGNYAGEELLPLLAVGKYSYLKGVTKGYRDKSLETATVESFVPNRHGLRHMGGNVWEWCGDWFDRDQKERVLRGGSWNDSEQSLLLSSTRYHDLPASRRNIFGFRVVIAPLNLQRR